MKFSLPSVAICDLAGAIYYQGPPNDGGIIALREHAGVPSLFQKLSFDTGLSAVNFVLRPDNRDYFSAGYGLWVRTNTGEPRPRIRVSFRTTSCGGAGVERGFESRDVAPPSICFQPLLLEPSNCYDKSRSKRAIANT